MRESVREGRRGDSLTAHHLLMAKDVCSGMRGGGGKGRQWEQEQVVVTTSPLTTRSHSAASTSRASHSVRWQGKADGYKHRAKNPLRLNNMLC